MKKIIIYGVTNIKLRKEIEYYLSEEYKVVGYSDTYYNEDVIEQKRYVYPDNISTEEVDYIVLAVEDASIQITIANYLETLGVKRSKIVTPVILLEKQFANYSYLKNDVSVCCKKDFRGVIFGLSYSRKGIIKSKLVKETYDFSRDGLDLYYNMQIYKYALQKGGFVRANYALCVFPYYYFDYDMSRSLEQYRSGQIFAVQGLNDWHNYSKCVGASNYVTNFNLFGKKYAEFYESRNYQPLTKDIIGEKDVVRLSNIWRCEHEETVAENMKLLKEFITLLKSRGMQIVIIVPPMYLENCSKEDKNAVEKKKEKFYKYIEGLTIDNADSLMVKDYTELYKDKREYFYNPDHLNYNGSEEFTDVINHEVIEGMLKNKEG